MKFKVGDKVKFLNENGGGVVSKIVNSNLVHVAISDGFDIPVVPNELIKISTNDGKGSFIFQNEQETRVDTPVVTEEPQNTGNERKSKLYFGKNAVAKGVYLAFAPQNQKFLITGDINVFIVNNTSYDITYNLIGRGTDNYTRLDHATLCAEEKIIIDTISRDNLSEWIEGYVQLLFHNDEMEKIPLPVHEHYKVQASKFFKEHSFKKDPLLNDNAIVIKIVELVGIEKVDTTDAVRLKEKEESTQKKKKVEAQKNIELIDNHRVTIGEAEVDLHISALRDDYNDLSNLEILDYQLKYFSSTLDNAIKNNYSKVTYIHGIGNGTLRNTIKKSIKNEYPEFGIRNASFSQYGNGAIDVLIPNNFKI